MPRERKRKRLREARVKITITHCTPGYPPKIVWFWWVTQPANYLKKIQVRYRENKLITWKLLAGVEPSISSSAFSTIGREYRRTILTCNRSWKWRTAEVKVLLETFLLMLSTFLPANLKLRVECQSMGYQEITHLPPALDMDRKLVSGCSMGPGVSHPDGDHPCTFWSLLDHRGSNLPE